MKRLVFLVIENSYIIRKGIKNILLDFAPTALVEELEDNSALLSTLTKKTPDVLFVNKQYVNADILNANTHFIVLTEKEEDECLGLFWTKQQVIEYLEPLFGELIKNEENDDLSDREKEIVRNVALGLTNQEIGENLFISTHTVITHRKNIVKKLGIKTVSGLTVYAIFNNLVDPNEVRS